MHGIQSVLRHFAVRNLKFTARIQMQEHAATVQAVERKAKVFEGCFIDRIKRKSVTGTILFGSVLLLVGVVIH